MCVDKFPGSLFSSIDVSVCVCVCVCVCECVCVCVCVCVFKPRAHCFHYCSFVIEFDIRKDDSADFSVKFTMASWVSCGFREISELF